MAIGGVRKDVCKFSATNIAKKYGLTPNGSNKGRNIGTKIINISDHSSGQPNINIINCAKIKNWIVVKSIPITQCEIKSCPPRYENTDAKVHEPTNNQQSTKD
jgi:hypothetical protein